MNTFPLTFAIVAASFLNVLPNNAAANLRKSVVIKKPLHATTIETVTAFGNILLWTNYGKSVSNPTNYITLAIIWEKDCFVYQRFVHVDSYSIPDCSQGCDPTMCPRVPDCECGTYKDYCGCCLFCLKCPGQQCSLVAQEKCADNTTCKPREAATGLERINGPGWCT